jgi:glutathione synthetase
MRICFTHMYSLDSNEEGDLNAEMASKSPHNFVMKPQREGGGNNVYDEEIVFTLNKLTREERSTYILMDKIKPPSINTISLRNGKFHSNPSVSELGIFGIYLIQGNKEILNRSAGHLFRTKATSVKEGGVATGFSVLDSPFLID